MFIESLKSRNFRQLLSVGLIVAAFALPARADVYWDIDGATAGAGGATPSGNWTSANWSTDSTGSSATAAWTPGEIAVFSAGTDATGAYSVNLQGTSQTVGGIVIDDGGVNISNGTLLIDTGSITRNSVNSLQHTISTALQGSGTLTFDGVGSSITFITGVINDSGGVRDVRYNSTGTVLWAMNNPSSTYSGDTVVDSGFIAVIASSTGSASTANLTSGVFGTGTLVLNSGTIRATTSGNRTVGNAVTLGGDFSFGNSGTKTLIFDGPLTLTGTHTLTFNSTATEFAGVLGDGGNGYGFIKDGSATAILSGDNTFTGGLTIEDGTVQLGHAGALNSASPNEVIFADNANAKTLHLNGNSVTISRLTDAGSSTDSTVENDNATAATLTLDTASEYTFVGSINDGAGGGALSIVKTGVGTQGLTGDSDFTGTVSVIGGGILRVLDVADGGANSNLGAGSSAIALGDASTTGGLWFNNTTTDSTNRGLTLGDAGGIMYVSNGGTLTVSGQVTGDGTLTKEYAGLLILSGDNTYTGQTNVNGGSIVVAHDNALGSAAAGTVVANGARLRLQGGVNVAAENVTTNYFQSNSGNNTWGGTVQNINASQLNIESNADLLTINGDVIAHGVSDGNHTLNLRGAGNGVLNGDITGVYGLVKLDAGTWTIAGAAKDWTTTTTGVNIAGGTLLINTTVDSNQNWTVQSGTTLGGNGDIIAPTVVVNAGGTLAAGNSIDQLDITGDLDLNGDLLVEVLGANIDRIDVSGLLDLSAATDSLTISGTLTEAVYVIASYGSSSSNFAFDTLTNLQGYSIDYAYDDGNGSNHIALLAQTVIPAPLALPGGLVLIMFAGLRRRID
ncbi:hypothetical protein HED60_05105 [Planctomycetales bacterium ZRK34]|nr:hypothetical protein HED60_05105 [Planctomycetales bacterium ZRK34]